MKNQTISYRLNIYLLLFLLSITFRLIGQEVIREEGFMYTDHTHNEDSLKNRFGFDRGSKKHRSEEIMMPVERYPAGLLSEKKESTKSGEEWDIHRVHSGKLFSYMSDRSLALDADGKPHIAYGQTHLYYAWYDEEWHTETVDDSWDVGMDASIALDSDGYPHISYYDRDPNGDLKYAYKDEKGWHIMTVDDDGTVGWFTSIALDANNHPHISYHDGTNGNLKYTYWDGSDWLIQTIDSEGVVGYWRTSLAIGPNNFPHISYYDWTNGNLKYTHWDGSYWQIVTVDNDDDVGESSSLALDENGYPHISYLDYANARLKYAFWNGSDWQFAIVDDDWDVGWDNSIVLDESGNPHISYYDNTYGKLRYAHWSDNESEWQIVTVDDDWDVGWFTSLALDINEKPHISYYYSGRSLPGARRGLRFAYYDGSEWQYDHVDYELYMGGATSVAVNNESIPHIGYWRSDHTLGYTVWEHNEWSFQQFKSTEGDVIGHVLPEPGSGSFLELDANDRPYLIYQAEASNLSSGDSYPSFILIWHDGEEWISENLIYDSYDWMGKVHSSSLVLDLDNSPHISVRYDYGDGLPHTYLTFRYMYRVDNEWHESNIPAPGPDLGIDNTIAIDSDGLPHISIRGDNYPWGTGLFYARFDGDTWNIQTIEDIGVDEYGAYNSLKIDSYNFPHISYYDPTSTALKYARWDGSEWHIEIVDNNGDVGEYTSLALDANDYPHISYYDETNGNLKFAYWDGSQWQIETLDSYGTVGLYTSLALDANGNAHISYYDASYGDLKYASKRALETNLTIVASAGDNGSIVPSGEIEVEYGHDQIFNINPDEGFRIAFIKINETEIDLEIDENWDAENGQYIFSNVTKDHTIEVGFIIITYTISAAPNNENFGTVSGGGEYDHFEEVTLKATPATGYHFVNWTENNIEVSRDEEYLFSVESDRDLVAHFAINEYTLTYEAGDHGSITGETAQTVEHGADGTEVEAIPDEGYHFTEWSDGVSTAKRTDTNVTGDLSVTASFSINVYTIEASVNNDNYGTITGAGTYEHGETVTLTAASSNATNFIFSNWTEEGSQVHDQPAYTFEATADRTLVANFRNVTSVALREEIKGIKVYPIPTGDILIIESETMLEQIRLLDLLGKVHYSEKVNQMNYALNVSHLQDGIYILIAVTQKGFSAHRVQIAR